MIRRKQNGPAPARSSGAGGDTSRHRYEGPSDGGARGDGLEKEGGYLGGAHRGKVEHVAKPCSTPTVRTCGRSAASVAAAAKSASEHGERRHSGGTGAPGKKVRATVLARDPVCQCSAECMEASVNVTTSSRGRSEVRTSRATFVGWRMAITAGRRRLRMVDGRDFRKQNDPALDRPVNARFLLRTGWEIRYRLAIR